MKSFESRAPFLLLFLLVGCGTSGAVFGSGVGVPEPPGANCPYGGFGYSSASGVVDYICDGAPGVAGPMGTIGPQGPDGANGEAGAAGLPGLSVVAAADPELPGENCAYGGIAYTSASGVDYVCNGAPGAMGVGGATGPQGSPGLNGAAGAAGQSVAGASEPAGDNCANGGVEYTSASGVAYVCNGAGGLTGSAGQSVVAASEPAGVHCATGGIEYTSASGVAYVCNGAGGATGPAGEIGPQGATGAQGTAGAAGTPGATGDTGPQGDPGTPGTAGAPMAYGYFYALMPGDNSTTIGANTAVNFPQDGAASGITRRVVGAGTSDSEFILPTAGVYEVSWQVSVTEAGQLVLGLGALGTEQLSDTVVGRTTGNSQITNHVLVETNVANRILTVRNPVGNSTALTMTLIAGGLQSVSASLLIKQIE